jgi:hypothetical protein
VLTRRVANCRGWRECLLTGNYRYSFFARVGLLLL